MPRTRTLPSRVTDQSPRDQAGTHHASRPNMPSKIRYIVIGAALALPSACASGRQLGPSPAAPTVSTRATSAALARRNTTTIPRDLYTDSVMRVSVRFPVVRRIDADPSDLADREDVDRPDLPIPPEVMHWQQHEASRPAAAQHARRIPSRGGETSAPHNG